MLGALSSDATATAPAVGGNGPGHLHETQAIPLYEPLVVTTQLLQVLFGPQAPAIAPIFLFFMSYSALRAQDRLPQGQVYERNHDSDLILQRLTA